MLNLDNYINNTVEVTLGDVKYDVKEPSVGMILEMKKIEQDLDASNIHEKRLSVAALIMSANKQGKKFTESDLSHIPYRGLEALIKEISRLRQEADTDPN